MAGAEENGGVRLRSPILFSRPLQLVAWLLLVGISQLTIAVSS